MEIFYFWSLFVKLILTTNINGEKEEGGTMKKSNINDMKPVLKRKKEMNFMSVREYDCSRYFVIVNEIDGDVIVRLSSKNGLGPDGEIISSGMASFDFPGGIVDGQYLDAVKSNIEELKYWFLYFKEKEPTH